VFERRSSQFGSQTITKALSSKSATFQLFAIILTEAVRHSDHKPAYCNAARPLVTPVCISNQLFSLYLSLHQLTSPYFKTQRPHKFHNRYRHLKYKCYRCIVVPPFVTMYRRRITFQCCHSYL